ncbi:MAG TPA: DUF3618 domain-containing protein [Candidatus Polarisedimenticolaceae bacterium]|nr:DUF3618 domain-containing protein [Candidatus Polarisedimenticolaceae bacterium]
MDERPDVDARSTEEIERDIEATRDSIKETVEEIGERLHRAVDWRTYVRASPWVALAVAAGAGIFVGRWIASARRRPGPPHPPRLPYPPAPET